jgi:phage shock protein PspC (stress-responsive transcriptional regulator)
MNDDCTRALDGLRLALEGGSPLDPETLAHLERCPTCRTSLGIALKGLRAEQEASPAFDPALAEAEVGSLHRRRVIWRSLGVAATLVVALIAAPLALPISRGVLLDGTRALVLLLLGALAAIVLGFWLARAPARLGLYKRLGPGRQLSGVCLGLSRRTATPVWAWRVGFLLLCLLPGLGHATGFWLYLMLDLAMPIHPEDRARLLRFRLARWWRSLRARVA